MSTPGLGARTLIILVALGCADGDDDRGGGDAGRSSASCGGACSMEGLRCAEEAGLADMTFADAGTAAEVFFSWLTVSHAIVAEYCAYLDRCGDPAGAGPCAELGSAAVETTCCARAIELYLRHRGALEGCATSTGLACGASFEAFCPPLADQPFEEICVGQR